MEIVNMEALENQMGEFFTFLIFCVLKEFLMVI